MHHIVLLEDNANDAELIERALVHNGIEATIDIADDRAGFEHLLERTKVDLVISDSGVGDFTALDAVKMTKSAQPQSGFIIVSGGFDAERAEIARRMGAIEWLPKTELGQLPPLVRLALEASEQSRLAENARNENSRLTLANQSVHRLIEAVTQLSMARDLATVQDIVRHAARAINGADGATFVLRDGHECYYADEDAIAPLWKGQRFPLSACISGWAMINRRTAVVPDINADARIPPDAYRATFVKSLVVAPIRSDAPIGAIGNYWATHHVPTAAEVQFIQALADSTAIALENVELYQQLERRVAQRTVQLQEANQSLEEFSYFVSHDLRSPVRHINAFSTILEAELGVPTPMAQKSLDKIKTATATMNGMLEGLLALARLGAAAVDPAEVDMTALANEIAQVSRGQSITPVTIVIDTLPPAIGNEALLRQVWTNLLTNAVKFSSLHSAPFVHIGSANVSGQTRYFVRDNGVGFDTARADQLFMAFRRLHSENDFSGVGVGLAIVNRIVSRHGGRVWAESELDKGATFYFTLGNQLAGDEPANSFD
jgi:signal transduction histidine kinase/DNA-binding NarL/FixJ family response regulator